MADVTSSHNAQGICRVYVNGVLHIAFNSGDLAGMQSWMISTRTPILASIELTMRGAKPVLIEYDREDLWRAVLGEIDKALGPESRAALAGDPR